MQRTAAARAEARAVHNRENDMKNSIKTTAFIAAAALALAPGAAFAQNAVDPAYNTTTTTDTQYTTVEREDDRDFPWGLLGLLGLAGLLGRKRKEADIHVDARRDTRP
jgi:MYXO-CTERM domain-containing protein